MLWTGEVTFVTLIIAVQCFETHCRLIYCALTKHEGMATTFYEKRVVLPLAVRSTSLTITAPKKTSYMYAVCLQHVKFNSSCSPLATSLRRWFISVKWDQEHALLASANLFSYLRCHINRRRCFKVVVDSFSPSPLPPSVRKAPPSVCQEAASP